MLENMSVTDKYKKTRKYKANTYQRILLLITSTERANTSGKKDSATGKEAFDSTVRVNTTSTPLVRSTVPRIEYNRRELTTPINTPNSWNSKADLRPCVTNTIYLAKCTRLPSCNSISSHRFMCVTDEYANTIFMSTT